jgi:hypothetical protein
MAIRVLAAVAVLAAAVPAVARPDQVPCNLLPDEEGDVQPMPGTDNVPVPDERTSQLDILSADIAADAKTLTVVIRLKDLTSPDPTNPLGLAYDFYFTAQEQSFWFVGTLVTGGNDFRVYAQDNQLEDGRGDYFQGGTVIGAATGTLDLTRHEIRMTAPLTLFETKAHLTQGTALYGLLARSSRSNGINTSGESHAARAGADQAYDEKAKYRLGEHHCIR